MDCKTVSHQPESKTRNETVNCILIDFTKDKTVKNYYEFSKYFIYRILDLSRNYLITNRK